jgi:hypothetical protein
LLVVFVLRVRLDAPLILYFEGLLFVASLFCLKKKIENADLEYKCTVGMDEVESEV